MKQCFRASNFGGVKLPFFLASASMSGIMHDAKLPKSVVLSLANGNVAMVVVGGC